MIKKYLVFLLFTFITGAVSAQDGKSAAQPDGLSFYPNPVSNGKIYINSKSTLEKDITIFDVLGKVVLHAVVNSRELNVSALPPGVYIIKIREHEATATRKLIVK